MSDKVTIKISDTTVKKINFAKPDQDNNNVLMCDICSKVVKNDKALKEHMSSHDETVQLCPICGVGVKGKKKVEVPYLVS